MSPRYKTFVTRSRSVDMLNSCPPCVFPVSARPLLRGPAARSRFSQSFAHAGRTGAQRKDVAYPFRFHRIHHQTSAFGSDIVAEHGNAADPLAFPPSGRELISGPLPDDLPLELRKREQDV